MPKYEYECVVCNIRFERSLKVGDHPTHECPECHDPAPLVLSQFGFTFAEGGKSPANSGVHDQDYPTADKAVGRSAKKRWEYLDSRNKVKKEVREKGGSPALIRHTGNGWIDYEAMSNQGREARRKLVKEARRVVSEEKNSNR
jgi:putative FmdB family regulatory protein